MFTQSPQMNNRSSIAERPHTQGFPSFSLTAERETIPQPRSFDILRAVLESLEDGILILTPQGQIVHANARAQMMCQALHRGTKERRPLPDSIWRVCHSLVEGREIFPKHPMIIESEVITAGATKVRAQARWLAPEEGDRPYVLVTLEDLQASMQKVAIADVEKYGLTPREAEVWMLRRADCSYKEIAAQLYITLNTVKKHMKNIQAKRQQFEWAEEV